MEVIRSELRCALAEKRQNNRALALNDGRRTLGEPKQNLYSLNRRDIAVRARELKRTMLLTEDYLALQNSLIQDEANITTFLESSDVLNALSRDLSCGNPAIQLIAAGCCCNIALANSDVCTLLAKVTGPYLIAQLHTLNYPLLEICAWTIGNLSAGSRCAFEVLSAQGCLRPLISLIDDCNENVVSSILYALKRCLYSGHDIITDPEVKDLTEAVYRGRNFSGNSETLWILALLSSREASHETLFLTIGTIIQLLWETMACPENSNVELVTPGIRILGNTVSEPRGVVADTFLQASKTSDTAKLFDKLLSHPRFCIRKESLWLLGNLYTHVHPRIRERVRKDLIPSLVGLNLFVS